MKSATFFFSILLLIKLAAGCSGVEEKKTESKASLFATTLDIDERLKKADSLVVVFYKDPYGTDSLRYTRYYTQISIVDSTALNLLQQQLLQKTSKQEKYRNCRGEGKIWCYTKNKIFQTIYFSTQCNNCCHVYIIKDGFYYYTPIRESTSTWLSSLKPLSKSP